MKKIFLVLIVSLFAANVYADSHVKRILSTSQTGMGNDIVSVSYTHLTLPTNREV